MNFLKKKFGKKSHRTGHDEEPDFGGDEDLPQRVPISNKYPDFEGVDAPAMVKARSSSAYLQPNNGYAGDLSRSTPKNVSLMPVNGAGKPLFQQQEFSTWPDDEFNDNYIDPSSQSLQHHEAPVDEYDSPDEMDRNIGQTGFFGSDDVATVTEAVPPILPPPLHHACTAPPKDLDSGHRPLRKTPLASKTSLPNNNQSSAPASSSVSRQESLLNNTTTTRRSSCGPTVAQLAEQSSSSASPVSNSSASSDATATDFHRHHHKTSQQQQQQQPPRPQPKVLCSRFSEGLDPNKVVTGIQTMVKMNNQPGVKVPQTPPKPGSMSMPLINDVVGLNGNQSRSSRFMPQTVTPPESSHDSDECEPELPARMKSMAVTDLHHHHQMGPVSPSPPSSEASSGTTAPPAKKRQAPLPPPLKTQQSFKTSSPSTLQPSDAPLPEPVPDFKVAAETVTPSLTASSDAGSSADDTVPPILINKESSVAHLRHRLSLQHTTSSPVAYNPASQTTFPTRLSSGNGSSSTATSGIGSSCSSNSTSSNRLPTMGSTSLANKVQIKLPITRQDSGKNLVAATAFTANKPKTPSSSSLQVTVVSTGASVVKTSGANSRDSVLSEEDDGEIYSGAESLQYNLFTFEWYHGKMSRDESERKLRENGCDGAFLVRDCNNVANQPNALFTLCLFARQACHYIQVCRRPEANDRLAVGSQKESEKTFATLQELIKFHMSEAPLVVQPRATANDPHPSHFLCSLKHPIVRRD